MILEKEIEKKFCQRVESRGGMTVKFSDPSRRGAPDRLVIEQDIYFVEFKRPKGVIAKHQIEYAKRLEDLNVMVYLIETMEQTVSDLKDLSRVSRMV